MKDNMRGEVDFRLTDQNRGVPPPPVQKPVPEESELIRLPKPADCAGAGSLSLYETIKKRKSVRKYSNLPLTLKELSFLLWACQGVRGREINGHAFRSVPSAGCRHSMETYIAVLNVKGLDEGVYRFLPLSHCLILVSSGDNLRADIEKAVLGQAFAARSGAVFIWTAIPYRMEWRYGKAAHKVIALDAGHACQNLCLGAVSSGAGACALAAYDQNAADKLVGADGDDEFVLYLACAGKL